jgi:hypothetical protein
MKQVLATIDQIASYLEDQPLYKSEAAGLADIFIRIAKKYEVEARHRGHGHKKKNDIGSNPPPQNLYVGPDGNFTDGGGRGGDGDGDGDGDGGGCGDGGGGGGGGASSKSKVLTAAPLKFKRNPTVQVKNPESRRVADFDDFFGREAAQQTEEVDNPGLPPQIGEVDVDEVDLVDGDDSIFGDSKDRAHGTLRDILKKFPGSHLDLTNSDADADIVPVSVFMSSVNDELLNSEAHLDGDMIGIDVPGHGYEIVKIVRI